MFTTDFLTVLGQTDQNVDKRCKTINKWNRFFKVTGHIGQPYQNFVLKSKKYYLRSMNTFRLVYLLSEAGYMRKCSILKTAGQTKIESRKINTERLDKSRFILYLCNPGVKFETN